MPDELRQMAHGFREAAVELEQWAKIKPGQPGLPVLMPPGPNLVVPAPSQDGPAIKRLPRLESPPTAVVGLSDNLNPSRGGAQRILNALAWLEGVGIHPARRAQVAVLAKLAPTSGTFKTYAGGLRTAGKIHYPTPGSVALTDQGRAEASTDDVPSTPEALQTQVLDLCTGGQKELLRETIRVYPEAVAREDLRDRVGMENSGTFKTYLGQLRTLGFVEYPGPGLVKAAPILFLEN